MEYIYIKYDLPKHYFVLDHEMDNETFPDLGTTYEDYLNNKWVKLSDEQIAFKEANPNAKISEVWNMELLPTIEPTLDEVKNMKLNEIEIYDKSTEVNSFTINNALVAWFTPEERSNYKSSIEAAKLLEQDTLTFFIGDIMMEISVITEAEIMLSQIQLYADKCYLVTKQHMLNIKNLESIEDVKAYDFTVGYPDKLNFNLD